MAKPYFTREAHFTNPVRDLLHSKKSIAFAMLFLLVGEGGFEPPKSSTTDLQREILLC